MKSTPLFQKLLFRPWLLGALAVFLLSASAPAQTTTLTINSSTGLINVPSGVTPNFATLHVAGVSPGGGGGGSAIDVPQTAWLSPAGDDSTAALGDPAHPFSTAQAAYNAGAVACVLEPNGGDSFGTIDTGGAGILMTLIGSGDDTATVAIVTHGGAATITGNGRHMVAATIVTDGAPGTGGTTGAGIDGEVGGTGNTGNTAGALTVAGIHLTSVSGVGGAGGVGGTGGVFDTATSPGGSGGVGGVGGTGGNGGVLTATDCLIDAVVLDAGAGGAGGTGGAGTDEGSLGYGESGGSGGNGGNGGVGGEMNLNNCILSASFSTAPGAAGVKGTIGSSVNGASASDNGVAGSGGSPGTATAYFTTVSFGLTSSYSSAIYRSVVENGVFVGTQN